MKDFHYYIIPKPVHIDTDRSNLSPGELIFRIPKMVASIEEGEGPFTSISELRKRSRVYKFLLKSDPNRAQKIVQERFIRNIEEFMRVPAGKSYNLGYIKLFEHIGGRVKKGEVTGVHFYDSSRVRINEISQVDFYTGVWEASIEFFNKKAGKWIKKHKPSTFFPYSWTREKTFHECNFAFETKKKEASSDYIYNSVTLSGIPVKIVVVKGEMKSLYPILKYN